MPSHITLPPDYELAYKLSMIYDHEVIAIHLIPGLAAIGGQTMTADEIARHVLSHCTDAKPILLRNHIQLQLNDLRLIALVLCDNSGKEFFKKVSRTLDEILELEEQFQAPSSQDPS